MPIFFCTDTTSFFAGSKCPIYQRYHKAKLSFQANSVSHYFQHGLLLSVKIYLAINVTSFTLLLQTISHVYGRIQSDPIRVCKMVVIQKHNALQILLSIIKGHQENCIKDHLVLCTDTYLQCCGSWCFVETGAAAPLWPSMAFQGIKCHVTLELAAPWLLWQQGAANQWHGAHAVTLGRHALFSDVYAISLPGLNSFFLSCQCLKASQSCFVFFPNCLFHLA